VNDFVVVANRLPVDRVEDAEGNVDWKRSPGGLVTALEPLMRRRSGAWVGWQGSPTEDRSQPTERVTVGDIAMVQVPITSQEIEDYYEGFSNGSLWPLYHDVVAPPEFHRHWYEAYRKVNQRFADATAKEAGHGATVWVQDYQLQLVPKMLRALRSDLRIGFFLHIPFPPAELYMRLPWRKQLMEGLLGADLVGFQRAGAAANFVRLSRELLGLDTTRHHVTTADGRVVTAKHYPISIDFAELDTLARQPATLQRSEELSGDLGDPEHVILGVDRLDYTKGIDLRLKAFGELLDDGRINPDKVRYVQVATPSRERVEQYRLMREHIEAMVGRINGTHGRIGKQPIHYLHSSFDRHDLVALFHLADVALITPLRDGMNLVAKEYVASRVQSDGVLILSEFAGAAVELKQALLVNPYDTDAMKDAILQALAMPHKEQVDRMRPMRRRVRTFDVAAWAQSFLDDLAASGAGSTSTSGRSH
jgi:trehalose 6-phosphate synthase